MSPPGPHLDQAVPPRWMIVQEGDSSGEPRGHGNLKTRAALVQSGHSVCYSKLLKWKM